MSLPVLSRPDAIILSYQRSGTHFLQSMLASHPKVHARGEFVLRYRRMNQKPSQPVTDPLPPYLYSNHPSAFNIAIVMYSQVSTFEAHCGSLLSLKIIHLLRNPKQVARSIAQMEADRKQYGSEFRAHFRLNETPPPPAQLPNTSFENLERKVRAAQDTYTETLRRHENVLTVSYESLTNNAETNELSASIASPILSFLGLPYAQLSCDLKKQHK